MAQCIECEPVIPDFLTITVAPLDSRHQKEARTFTMPFEEALPLLRELDPIGWGQWKGYSP